MNSPTEIESDMNQNPLHAFHTMALALLLTLAVFGRDANAADAGGLIEGVAGEQRISIELDPNQSDAYSDGNSGSVSIMSRPVAPQDGLGRIAIGFEGSDFRAGRFSNFEVDLGVAGESGVVYRATLDDGLEVTVEHIELRDDLLHVEARVRGNLTRQEPRTRVRDDADVQAIDLRVSVRVANES